MKKEGGEGYKDEKACFFYNSYVLCVDFCWML